MTQKSGSSLNGSTSSVYRIRNWRKQFLIILPAASVQILATAKIGVSLALLVMVVAEFVGVVSEIVEIPLGQKRNQDATKLDPRFAQLRKQVLDLVRS